MARKKIIFSRISLQCFSRIFDFLLVFCYLFPLIRRVADLDLCARIYHLALDRPSVFFGSTVNLSFENVSLNRKISVLINCAKFLFFSYFVHKLHIPTYIYNV